jgi:imidazole glycerol-phosphate synthase subunit HisH
MTDRANAPGATNRTRGSALRVTVFDTGAGNLHSLVKALAGAGREVLIEPDPLRAIETDALVLPGVGAFAPAAERLAPARERVRDAIAGGLPCLGICLGMQLLFERSEEGEGEGLGVFAGAVTRLRARRVPHMGWNTLDQARDPALIRSSLSLAYFANGFACRPTDDTCVTAWCTHENDRFAAVVRGGSTMGCQFHPEKSSEAGVRLLHAWLEECVTCA